MINQNFVILGALVNLAGSSNYIINTLKGRTKPNRVSFFMWTLAPMIAFSAELQKGIGIQSLITFMAGFCPFLIFLASFKDKKSYWRLTTFDLMCGVLSLVGLSVWAVTRQGNLAIVFAILADLLAALPTFRKAYLYPHTESWLGYFSAALSAAVTLLTIKHWTFATYGFPVYLFLCCSLLTTLVKFRFWESRLVTG